MKNHISLCGYCDSPRIRLLYTTRDYISGESFEIIQCTQCGLVRTLIHQPMIDFGRYYDRAYYGQQVLRFLAIMERMILVFRRSRSRFIQQLHPKPGRILDIGCGRGLMLAELKRNGWECIGTEAEENLAIAVERIHGFHVRFTTDLRSQFPAASFDVITLWHILEHTADPIGTLKEVYRLLKPIGYVIVETPNFASLQARLGRGLWFHLDAPRHQYHFSASGLSSILQEQGFRVIQRRTFSLEYGFYGFIQTILNYATRQPNVLYNQLKGSRHTKMGLSQQARGMDDLLTIMTLPFAFIIAIILEIAANIVGGGGVIRLTAMRQDSPIF